jgi:hypothetical protein
MAAWLAFLKSRLLLPEPAAAEGPSAEELANALAQRLRRLEAIREAASRLMTRPQLGRDVFARGTPENIAEIKHPQWTATLYDLLRAYAVQAEDRVFEVIVPKALNRLSETDRLLGGPYSVRIETQLIFRKRVRQRAIDGQLVVSGNTPPLTLCVVKPKRCFNSEHAPSARSSVPRLGHRIRVTKKQ